jgi:hypothetical protein
MTHLRIPSFSSHPMKIQNMNRHLVLLAASLSLPGFGLAADTNSEVPKEVVALVGTYTGSWKTFGIDGQGQVVQRNAWTDTMKAERPVREAERAWVSTEDVMVFEARPGAPFKLAGKEGYRLNPDGTLGEYFIETFGQTYRMQKLAEDVWSYATDASPQELAQLGFPKGAAGRHVAVKVVTKEAGVETHRISRITTVSWRDSEGKERWLQYVSLQGLHQRSG